MQTCIKIKPLLVLFMVVSWVVVAGCGGGKSSKTPEKPVSREFQAQGSVSLVAEDGSVYSFQGADVSVSDISQASKEVRSGKQIETVSIGASKVDQNGHFSLILPVGEIEDEKLYVVEVACPEVNELCEVASPIRALLSGSDVRSSSWVVTILTEVAYQKVAYYVATDYLESDLKDILNDVSNWLLHKEKQSVDQLYSRVLSWSPLTDFKLVKKKELIYSLQDELVSKRMESVALQSKVRGIASPYIGEIVVSGEILDIKSIEHYAYVAAGSGGLKIMDIENPANPKKIGEMDFEGYVIQVEVLDDLAYVLYSNVYHDHRIESQEIKSSGFAIVDISNRVAPKLISSTNFSEAAQYFCVEGSKVYLSYFQRRQEEGEWVYYDSGFNVYDISDLRVIKNVGNFWSEDLIVSMQARESSLYVVAFDSLAVEEVSSFFVVNVASPEKMMSYRSMEIEGRATSLVLSDDIAIVTGSTNGVIFYDISVGGFIKEISTFDAISKVSDAVLIDNYLYLIGSVSKLKIVDVSNFYEPKFVISVPFFGQALRISNYNSMLFLSSSKAAAPIIDVDALSINGPRKGVSNRQVNTSVALKDNVVYMSSGDSEGSEINIFTKNPLGEFSLERALSIDAYLPNMKVDGSKLLVSDLEFGLRVFDVDDPLFPQELATNSELGNSFQLEVRDNYIYTTKHSASLGVVEYSKPGNLEVVFSGFNILSTDFNFEKLDTKTPFSGQYQGVLGHSWLLSIDVKVPNNPILLDYVELPFGASSFVQSGDYAYVSSGFTRVFVIDTSEPRDLQIVATLPDFVIVQDVLVSEDYLYVVDAFYGIHVYDVKNPSIPTMIGSVETLGSAMAAATDGTDLYVASTYGLEIFRTVQRD